MGSGYDKSLREGLPILLLHSDPSGLLQDQPDCSADSRYRTFPSHFSMLLPKARPEQFSGDDAKQVASILKKQYDRPDSCGIFSLILDFADQTLVQRDLCPMVRYEQVLRWRQTVHPLGTAPFVCAFLAGQDLRSGTVRRDFCLDPILQTDNRRLKAMLSQGMAENHFHLKGSSRACMLSWVSLMNDITGRAKTFRAMERLELGESTEGLKRPLHLLVLQAAAIRALLFAQLEEMELGDAEPVLRNILQAEHLADGQVQVQALQGVLNSLRSAFGASLSGTRPDYAIESGVCSPEQETFLILSGEYRFQYRMFRAIYQKDVKMFPYLDLFYAYLMISIRFRAELIQCNRKSGFQNFSDYDGRKGDYVRGRELFEQAYEAGAAAAVLLDPRVRSLEVRIVPKEDAGQLAEQIHRIDNSLTKGNDPLQVHQRMYYVLHIPKQPDAAHRAGAMEYIRCRDDLLRRKAAAVAQALIRLREGDDSAACRIRGIDACANEIDARPEIFAVSFRRLKAHQLYRLPSFGKVVPMLHVTYHVGEDFLDLTDGLRAVWEAVEFLELGRSDRIGHGLALGIDPEAWYKAKQYRVYLTRQALLDNCAWMLYLLESQGNMSVQLARELKEECAIQYSAIYQSSLPHSECEMNFDSSNYFHSLELRGDDPAHYRCYQNLESYGNDLEFALGKDPYCLRQDQPGQSCYTTRRHNLQAIRLYHHYHYNPLVKMRGDEVVEYQVSKHYVRAVAHLQSMMQQRIARLGIGIEANPSSNVLIGSFKRYDKHPLVAFNDRGLFDSADNPNLFVSINTDDQGVFDTCLENEYALMARSLEQLTDQNAHPVVSGDRIYGWLDHIRQMGLEQSFLDSSAAVQKAY